MSTPAFYHSLCCTPSGHFFCVYVNAFKWDVQAPGLSFHSSSTLHWREARRVDRGNEGKVSGVKLELLIRAPPLNGILCRTLPL